MRGFPILMSAFFAASVALAGVTGASVSYNSPRGVTEECVRVQPIPGSVFSTKEQKDEDSLCAIDIYDQKIAVCPKTWSTSPGTILFSIEGSGLTQSQFEDSKCSQSASNKYDKLGKFKNSMNAQDTSGTYAQSSILYYEFAHYFQTAVSVPVVVYRTFDREEHEDRVSSRARAPGGMIAAGWEHLLAAEENPRSYSPVRDLFTPDLQQIYGVILDDGGPERYGTEINGIRSSWGDGQNNDFQNTPAFLALRSPSAFAQAVVEGERQGRQSSKINSDLGSIQLTPVQMGLWMRELTEITLLDYIFSQQDRIGNIDYEWYWIYAKDGKVKTQKEKRSPYKDLSRRSMKNITPPAEIAVFHPQIVQRTFIDDNDAGGKVSYANFTKRTHMLEKIRHYDAGVYRRLVALNSDLASQGPIYRYVSNDLNLTSGEVKQIVQNTAQALQILQGTCLSGQMHFDLDADQIGLGQARDAAVDCRHP